MIPSKKLLSELQNRLKVGNRAKVHLNAIPSRSPYKFDLQNLSYIQEGMPQDFIDHLLSEQPLSYKISWKESSSDIDVLFNDKAELSKIQNSFLKLISQTESIEQEKGINTFGFGFPLFARVDQKDEELTVAPILIWSLKIEKTAEFHTWVVKRSEDDPIYVNEVLINHLQSDSDIKIKQISSEMLDDGLIDKQELVDICVELVETVNTKSENNLRELFFKNLNNVKAIPSKAYFNDLTLRPTNAIVVFAGLFSIFEVQKQSIIDDYDALIKQGNISLSQDTFEFQNFQSLSSVKTDPSQQGVLNSIPDTKNILIQGPPGTGKSQTLTAVLLNAMENGKKTLVVCEKITALDVLYDALLSHGLADNAIIIKDVIKDRRAVVDSVRSRTELMREIENDFSNGKQPLEGIVNRSKTLINSINASHQKLGARLFGNHGWPATVGMLLSEMKTMNNDLELEFDANLLTFSPDELEELTPIIRQGEALYREYITGKDFSFINPVKFKSNNPFEQEQALKDNLKLYSILLSGSDSEIKQIREKHSNNKEFNDYEKTGTFTYKLMALFSKKKKLTIKDQTRLLDLVNSLRNKINDDGWFSETIKEEKTEVMITSIENLLTKAEEYFKHSDDLFANEYRWFNFYLQLSQSQKEVLNALQQKSDWVRVWFVYYVNLLLTMSASPELPTEESRHHTLQEELMKLEKEQKELIKKIWAQKQALEIAEFERENPNLSLKNLYNKRSSTKYKRLTLRQIVKYDTDLFTSFFPVILTNPDVCSNIFQGLVGYFDIVLFDEASQLRLEDNFPALLKGKQSIIAGDEHQMPPDNYFSKILEGSITDEDDIADLADEDEIRIDEDDIILSSESLLEFASEQKYDIRHLDFHYRSKHPYLIDFSNHAFYSKRLIPLPNRFEYNPFHFSQVNGVYKNNMNEDEADRVLWILEHEIQKNENGKYPSIGIATFNVSQRDLIKRKILDYQKSGSSKVFKEKLLELDSQGMWVKNLVNIQGDEKDVIILSTTYGVKPDGKFYQFFGPLNQKKGYKLLNVIITRAKYKVYVCTSVPEAAYLNYKEELKEEGSNNRRAVFYSYLAYAKAVSEQNIEAKDVVLKSLSDNYSSEFSLNDEDLMADAHFEKAVYQSLSKALGEEKLTLGYRYAGFLVDVLYESDIEGVPKIAIECDSAPYHRSREAYLFDKHRKEILEGQGFKFYRTWSTNWWRNQEKETQKIVEFIRDIEASPVITTTLKPEYAFENNPEIINSIVAKKESSEKKTVPSKQDSGDYKEIDFTEKPEIRPGAKKVVDRGSKVELRYINNGKILYVQLGGPPEKRDSKAQDIGLTSQLALAILGKTIGDTIRVGSLENYVEILKIES